MKNDDMACKIYINFLLVLGLIFIDIDLYAKNPKNDNQDSKKAKPFQESSYRPDKYTEKIEYGNLDIQIDAVRGDGRGGIVIGPTVGWQLKNAERARVYSFMQDGTLQVMITTRDYPEISRATGARQFCLWPLPTDGKKRIASGKPSGNKYIITTHNGHRVVFSALDASLISIDGYAIKVSELKHIDTMISLKGGVELTPLKGHLLADIGWNTGSTPLIPGGMTAIVNSFGEKRIVPNSSLFGPDPKSVNALNLKFQNNSGLEKWLASNLPGFRK